MKEKSRLACVLLASCAVWCVLTSQSHCQQPYRWNRTAQTLGAAANVTVTVQGSPSVDNQARTTTNGNLMFYGATRGLQLPALGGGGGGGGDSGWLFGAAMDGADGNDEDPVDGADGAPGDVYTGLGGDAGQSGFADASGTTVCINELTPNLTKSLSYSWIHNQWADIKLFAAGGGGGGGGGSEGFEDPFTSWPGGFGGSSGRGENAAGTAVVTQSSDVDVFAVCEVEPGINPPPTARTNCAIFFDIGWVSAANPDWEAPAGVPWARTFTMTVATDNGTVLAITGAGGVLSATGFDDFNNPYFWLCPDDLNGDIGSFSIDLGGLGVSSIVPGEAAEIVVPANGVSSILSGAPTTRLGGASATGGMGGFMGMTFDGNTNNDGGVGGGRLGGQGGAGGIPDLLDLDMDTIPETFVTGGGRGGDGGAGERYDEHKDGIFQGTVTIEID